MLSESVLKRQLRCIIQIRHKSYSIGLQVERYTRAEHLLHDPALVRLEDVSRECRIYKAAASLIYDLPLMKDLSEEAASMAVADIPQHSPKIDAQVSALRVCPCRLEPQLMLCDAT